MNAENSLNKSQTEALSVWNWDAADDRENHNRNLKMICFSLLPWRWLIALIWCWWWYLLHFLRLWCSSNSHSAATLGADVKRQRMREMIISFTIADLIQEMIEIIACDDCSKTFPLAIIICRQRERKYSSFASSWEGSILRTIRHSPHSLNYSTGIGIMIEWNT